MKGLSKTERILLLGIGTSMCFHHLLFPVNNSDITRNPVILLAFFRLHGLKS